MNNSAAAARCSTRAVKILKYLQRTAPASLPRASIEALEHVPSSLLTEAQATSNWDKVTDDAQLKGWLAANAVPAATSRPVSSPLFHGTLVFVQLIFQEPDEPSSAVSLQDMQTAVAYMNLAIQPIHRYATTYGPNSVAVWPAVIPFTANLTGTSFTLSQFEGWVEQCGKEARAQNISNPCIVIMHNRDLANSPSFTGERDSFHAQTGDGTPYCYCLVFGENLNIADNNHLINGRPTDKVYAHNLSHEVAEIVVDPKGDDSNPEVCDGCAGNCNVSLFTLFDQNGVFIGGTSDTATASGFAYFINPIVSRGASLNSNFCVVPSSNAQSACIYPPPYISGELVSYTDAGTPGNVSNPMVVGFDGWLAFTFLFGGRNVLGQDRVYAVNAQGQLLSYGDAGTQGNVSSPVVVGFGGWLAFKFLFAGKNAAGEDRIYAVNAQGQLLSYGDAGTPGNVSSPVIVGFGGWADFKFLFAGRDEKQQDRIYAVNTQGQLLSYGDSGTPGNVSSPVVVGFGGWSDFQFLFSGRNALGQDRVYAVNSQKNGELLSYGDATTPGNVSNPLMVGFDDWLELTHLFGGRNAAGQDRIYAVAK